MDHLGSRRSQGTSKRPQGASLLGACMQLQNHGALKDFLKSSQGSLEAYCALRCLGVSVASYFTFPPRKSTSGLGLSSKSWDPLLVGPAESLLSLQLKDCFLLQHCCCKALQLKLSLSLLLPPYASFNWITKKTINRKRGPFLCGPRKKDFAAFVPLARK